MVVSVDTEANVAGKPVMPVAATVTVRLVCAVTGLVSVKEMLRRLPALSVAGPTKPMARIPVALVQPAVEARGAVAVIGRAELSAVEHPAGPKRSESKLRCSTGRCGGDLSSPGR